MKPRTETLQWGLWSPTYGVVPGSVRSTPGAAIRAVWTKRGWRQRYREGWRTVRVEVKAVYFLSTKPTMQKVPK